MTHPVSTPVHDLLHIQSAILQSLLHHPRCLLAWATACFDPYALQQGFSEDETDDLTCAIVIARSFFPEVYAEVVRALHRQVDLRALEHLICQGLTAAGIPVEHLEGLYGGIPMEAYGLNLYDLDVATIHPDVLRIASWFGVQLPVTVPEVISTACQIGNALMTSLVEQPDPRYQEIGWALGWLWSCTGNTLVDVTQEDLWDMTPLDWTAEGVAYGIAVIAEAQAIMSAVAAGLEHLRSDPHLSDILQRQIHHISKRLKKRRTTHDQHVFQLVWPILGTGDD
jgi:hypothetical protein